MQGEFSRLITIYLIILVEHTVKKRNKCSAKNQYGKKCGATALKGTDKCFYHTRRTEKQMSNDELLPILQQELRRVQKNKDVNPEITDRIIQLVKVIIELIKAK